MPPDSRYKKGSNKLRLLIHLPIENVSYLNPNQRIGAPLLFSEAPQFIAHAIKSIGASSEHCNLSNFLWPQ